MKPIIIAPTENPKVMKFVADYTLMPGSLELDREADLSEIPLAQELFQYPFVERIFITANFIAVAKQDGVEWEHLVKPLQSIISEGLAATPRVYAQKQSKEILVYSEMTPNPMVMKFVASTTLLDGFLEVKSAEESAGVPLAAALFEEFDFVKEVFISDQFVAVTKNVSVEWHEVMVTVSTFISDYLNKGGTVSTKAAEKHESPATAVMNRDYNETEQKISDILNEYVAPAVEGDGGKISLMEYDAETKTAKMLLQGACSGCPSSTATLKGGIESILKQFLPELVENVEAING